MNANGGEDGRSLFGKLTGRLGAAWAALLLLLSGGAGQQAEQDLVGEDNATVGDLQDLTPGNTIDPAKEQTIRAMSDRQLLDSVRRPLDGWGIILNRTGDVILNGNTRAQELLRRAADPNSMISHLTKIPIKGFGGKQ